MKLNAILINTKIKTANDSFNGEAAIDESAMIMVKKVEQNLAKRGLNSLG